MNMISFLVAENVVQKFDVQLDAPSVYVDSAMETISVAVSAKYHGGKPVKGTATITMRSIYAEESTGINKTNEISGSVNFSFTNKEILQIMYWGGINITATVYEDLTGIAVETFSYVRRENSLYWLSIISQKPEFERGQKFTAQIQVKRIDDKPLTKEEREKQVSVTMSYNIIANTFRTNDFLSTSDNLVWQNFTISESGIVSVELPVQRSVQWIQLQVKYQTAFQIFSFDKQSAEIPYIYINISETALEVGTPFHLQVKTNPVVEDLYYVVIAKGMVVAAGKNKTKFSLTPEQSWTPGAQLIVYIRNVNGSYGDIIQTALMLHIKSTLNNQVTLSWSKTSATPLESVTLSVNVKESNSLVGLRIVEKSFTLLGDGNDLTVNKINNESLQFYQMAPISLANGIIYNTYVPSGELVVDVDERFIPSLLPAAQSKPEFRETWIWLNTNISSGSSKNLQLTVPDKNTTWVATAFVISEGLGIGVTDTPVEISVVKPLFLTLNMPNTLVRGEEFVMEVLVLNNVNEDLEVLVTLESSKSFDIIEPNNKDFVAGQRNVNVPRQNGATVLFPIQPNVLGNISITVTATSKVASHTLTRYIIVRAEGVKYYYSETVLFDVGGTENAIKTVSKNLLFNFPSDLVQGSEEVFITIAGNLLDSSVDGLESLIAMPYGCGEQNMINFAPNIYILIYLILTNQIKPQIREKVINFMEQGYQRELLYRLNDGSFSAFGNSDVVGSTWLTSFVLRCFLQARPFIYIDQDVLNQAANFLVQHQDTNTGAFSEPGRVIHKDLQGGLNNDNVALTAYIVSSMLEDPRFSAGHETNVQKSVKHLEDEYNKGISSNYTLSIVAYALSLANSTKAQGALNLLNSRATTTATGETKYWSTPSANFYWQPRTADIETAAYALLCFHRQNRITDGMPVMNWLSQQRNHLGGYVSTQDTVMALQALAQFAAVIPSAEKSLAITLTGPGSFVTKTFQVDSKHLELQSKQIEVFQPLSLTATAVGYGLNALAQLNVMYNRKAQPRRRRNTVPEAFELDLKVMEDASDIYKLTVEMSMSYQGEGESGMVLIEFEFLTGFQLSDKGIPTDEVVGIVEVEDNKVNLYLYSLTKNTVTVSVPMVRYADVAGNQDAIVKIIEYYNPRNIVIRTYNSETMKKISICDFCGPDCNQCKSNVQEKTQSNGASNPTFFMVFISIIFLPYIF